VFQATAFKPGFEFALCMPRQNRDLLWKICREFRIASESDASSLLHPA